MKQDKNNMMPMNAADYRRAAEHHKQAAKNQWKTFLRTGFFALAALVAVAVLSVAWFANNKEVNSNGMQMQADVSENLVITKTPNVEASWDFSTSLSGVDRVLLPAMHVNSGDTNLQFVDTSIKIDRATGLSNDELTFTNVTKEDDSHYYIDYTVYISSLGKPLTADLTVEITSPEVDGDTPIYHKAASIDFYVNEEYKDTLNLAGMALSNDTTYNSSATKTVSDILATSIPCCSDGSDPGYITVVMRCYFDGALLRDATHTYVTTNDVDTSAFNLGVTFTATEATS